MNHYDHLGRGLGFGLIGAASLVSFTYLICAPAWTQRICAVIPFMFACACVTGVNGKRRDPR
jgi:hypothetical protein